MALIDEFRGLTHYCGTFGLPDYGADNTVSVESLTTASEIDDLRVTGLPVGPAPGLLRTVYRPFFEEWSPSIKWQLKVETLKTAVRNFLPAIPPRAIPRSSNTTASPTRRR